MSPSIQIRDVPDDVHRELRARAAAAGVSLSEYLREEITRVTRRPRLADVLARASSLPGGARQADIVRAVRAGRDRN